MRQAVASIDVTVHKPHAPIVVAFADVSVSISRVRATDNGRTAEKHAIHNAVVALGGNVGEVESTLRAAVREIDALLGTPGDRYFAALPHGRVGHG